jgi:C4-dicarboxylate transporter DctM subunit
MLGTIILGAHVFSTFFALTQTTQSLVAWVGGLPLDPWMIIVILVMIYIALGCFLDQMAILVLTVPVVAPLLQSMGFDLVWFGVIVIVTAELGMVTPPFGLNAFVVSKYSGTPLKEVFIGVWPHIVAHIIAIAILLLFPSLTLWLPNNM